MSEESKPLALSVPIQPVSLPAVQVPVAETYGPRDSGEPAERVVPFSHYLWILRRHFWRLLAFVVLSVGATVIVSSRLTPVYESTATVDIDRQMPSAAVGQDSRTPINDSDQFLTTQMRLIQSPSVLRPVAQHFKSRLNPQTAGGREGSGFGSAGFGPAVKDTDLKLSFTPLRVTRPPNTYLLLVTYRSPDRQFAADVANAVARSYIDHTYDIRFEAAGRLASFMQKQLEELRAKMERSSEALAKFEKDLNLINPEEKVSIISNRLLQLNTELTSAEADRVRKQAALESAMTGAIEALPSGTQGDQQVSHLIERINDASQKFSVVKSHYGVDHPEYQKASKELSELQRQFAVAKESITTRVRLEYDESISREKMLQASLIDVKSEYDKLNAGSFQYKSLKQEAETDKSVYDELIRKIQEASINAGFQNNSIRLADPAEPATKAVFPDITANALIAFLASALIGIAVAIVSDSLDQTLRDPEAIQQQLNTEVLGSLPIVKSWRGVLPGARGKKELGAAAKAGVLAGGQFEHAYDEAVRTLRDAIMLSNVQRPRTLLMTSATPREGKTTTAVHLAMVHSQQKRKTLLIDGDLRRPGVYHHLGINNDSGLSDIVRGDKEWRDVLQSPEAWPYLTVLPAGAASRRAADGLGGTLEGLLAEATKEYDLVICDAPPLLGFAESLQIAALVDAVVVVALAGQTNQKAVSSVFTSLRRLRANVLGVVLNEVRPDMSERYYYYGYYGKYYGKYYKRLED
jgi:capsular exopolysaccharide synthesis family protein